MNLLMLIFDLDSPKVYTPLDTSVKGFLDQVKLRWEVRSTCEWYCPIPWGPRQKEKKKEWSTDNIGLSLLPDCSVCPAASKFLPLWLLCQREKPSNCEKINPSPLRCFNEAFCYSVRKSSTGEHHLPSPPALSVCLQLREVW